MWKAKENLRKTASIMPGTFGFKESNSLRKRLKVYHYRKAKNHKGKSNKREIKEWKKSTKLIEKKIL